VENALKQCGLSVHEFDYISAHGTSTRLNDKVETLIIKKAFGEHAHRVPVNSVKSMIGHTLGAAGAIETAICALAIRDQFVHPTTNLEHPDPECDLDYVPLKGRSHEINLVLSNSFGFGGKNSALILRRFDHDL
jgi:3-oxoacyl-[acyl-carrier-protein] synthase II